MLFSSYYFSSQKVHEDERAIKGEMNGDFLATDKIIVSEIYSVHVPLQCFQWNYSVFLYFSCFK